MKPGKSGLQRVADATKYSALGLRAAWQHEAAFRQECVLAAILFPIAFVLGQSPAEVAILIAVLFVVIITELINSAIEAITDRIGSEHHELSGRAKDIGSAAVMLSLFLVISTWSVIAFNRFL